MNTSPAINMFAHVQKWLGQLLSYFRANPKKEALKSDAHVLSLLLSATAPEQSFSPQAIHAISEFLNTDPSEPAKPLLLDPQTFKALDALLEGFDDHTQLGDIPLEKMLNTLNGLDPALINDFLNKLMGKLDPEILEQLFRKIFKRLLSKDAITERTKRDSQDKISEETRKLLKTIRQETFAYLSERVNASKLSNPQTELIETIKRLSEAMAKSPLKGVEFAGIKLSSSLKSQQQPAQTPEDTAAPGLSPDPNPNSTPQQGGPPPPRNAPAGSPWRGRPKPP